MTISNIKQCTHSELKNTVINITKKTKEILKKYGDELEQDNPIINMCKKGNMACAIVYTNNETFYYISHSAINDNIEADALKLINADYAVAILPESEELETMLPARTLDNNCNVFSIVWPRDVDTESKLIKNIIKDDIISDNTKIHMWTHRYPCPSCRGIMQMFCSLYPTVELEVYYTWRNSDCGCDQ